MQQFAATVSLTRLLSMTRPSCRRPQPHKIVELWKYGAYGSLFLLANQCQPAGVHRLLTILAAFGFIVALFALVQDLTSNGKIYWFWPAVSGRIFGPYANHSHYAGLMEMLTP